MISYFKVKDKVSVVNYFYEQESEWWHNNIHKNRGSSDENVIETVNTMSDNTTLFVVNQDREMAGFFGYYEENEGKVLVGFHIAKKFRYADFIISFWEIVKSVFISSFFTGVYEKNKEAMNHLLLQGFKVVNKITDNKGCINILFLNQSICQQAAV